MLKYLHYDDNIAFGGGLMFRRKAYDRLLEWKEKYADKKAVRLFGQELIDKTWAIANINMIILVFLSAFFISTLSVV